MDRASESSTAPLLLLAERRLEGTNTMTIDSLPGYGIQSRR
jgi:hypothetical protein